MNTTWHVSSNGENKMNEKKEYNWNRFVEFCNEHGISLDHPDDYKVWWGCWKMAYLIGWYEKR